MSSDSLVFSAVAHLVAWKSGRIVLASAALALAPGCRGTLPPVPSAYPSDAAQAHMNSLRRSLGEIISAPGNLGRLSALRKRAAELRLESRTEWIDWFSLQRNVVIEVPSGTDRIVHLIAHYDKRTSR